jgi:hypothetical protein
VFEGRPDDAHELLRRHLIELSKQMLHGGQ